MTKRKLPDQLSTFPAELFGVLKWSHEKLTENGVEIKEVTVGSNLPKPQATRLRFRLNQLRKSLEFWAPNDELSEQAKNLMFAEAFTNRSRRQVSWKCDSPASKCREPTQHR